MEFISIIIIFVILVGIVLLFDIVRTIMLLRKTGVLMKKAIPFSRTVVNAQTNILVLGDSTMVGTGSEDPKNTTAGRLGSMYPNATITNISENGLKIAGLLEKIKTIDTTQKFDIILIQIGANDIIRFTSIKNIEEGIQKVLAWTIANSNKVIFLHSGNVGDSKFFPWYINALLSKRSYEVRDIYIKQAQATGAHYINLIDSSLTKVVLENPNEYYANDFLHLNDKGYGLWFDEIQKEL